MKATCWMGKGNVEVRDVPEPQIRNRRDAIVRITSTAIWTCTSTTASCHP
jgi:threonine dehydrogenase-like Zn-dependent dehydrogenase